MWFQVVAAAAAVLLRSHMGCGGINIHVAVVKTGLAADQTLLTADGSMRSSAARRLHCRRRN